MIPKKLMELARAMYEAYVADAGGLNYQGLPCPTWEDLPTAIITHWIAAARVAKPFEPKEGCITAQVVHGHAMVEQGDMIAIVPLSDVAELKAKFDAIPDDAFVPRVTGEWIQPLVNAVRAIVYPTKRAKT